MTDNVDHWGDGGLTPVRAVALVADLWLVIMNLLSPSDVVRLSLTCKMLLEYSQCHSVWYGALVRHRFLSKIYPHLLYAPTRTIRHQIITTARIDAAFSQDTLRPLRSYSFPLEFPGVFQGLRFIPGSDWLVLLFHSRMLNPARHSNICLFKPPMKESSGAESTTATSVALQSEWCWLCLGQQDGPYKSSRGDDLMLLRTLAKNQRRFAICHLDTKTPSIKITFMVHTTLQTRNHTAAGDYILYGWVTDDRKHMVRIMKLNEDYTGVIKDVIAEVDCPQRARVRKLMLHYDLRLSGKRPRLLVISTRLMAAYDISDRVLTSGCEDSPLKLHAEWKYVPENVSFGRVLRVLRESAIVTLYEGKVRFIYPQLDDLEANAKTIAIYNFSFPTPYSTRSPTVFTSQRIFWHLYFPYSSSTSVGSKHLIEAATIPTPSSSECKINRVFVDHDEPAPEIGSLACDAQDWDELSGKLCVRYVRSRFPHDYSWRKTNGRITILEMV